MQKICPQSARVHRVLSHSYSVYLVALIIGVVVDTFFKMRFSFDFYSEIGFLVIFIGTFLVYWAQNTSSASKKESINKNTPRDFARGPYKFTRNPTHAGLMFMMFGFGIVAGSFTIIILTLVAFTVSKLIFLPQEEKLLVAKYGAEYLAYQKKVNPWI